MTRLLRVELNRFFSRRAVALLLLAAALLTALIATTTLWDTRPVSDAERATARAQVAQQLADPAFQRDLRACEQRPEDYFGPGSSASDCDGLRPRAENYLPRSTLSLAEERDDSGIAVVVVLTALMIIVGTTYAGADWASGSMSNQLLFEPRRVRVWVGKALAVLVGCLVVSAVVVAAFWLTLYLTAQSRGIDTGATVQTQVRWLAARGVVLATAAGVGGYALTMLLRHTVATLAVLFAYAVGGEALLALAPIERAGRFSPATNVFAWIRDGVQVFDPGVTCSPGGGACEQQFTVSLTHGATYLGVLLVVAILASALSFRRRDVP